MPTSSFLTRMVTNAESAILQLFESIDINFTRYKPIVLNVCEMEGVVVVTLGLPSLKSHTYFVPMASVSEKSTFKGTQPEVSCTTTPLPRTYTGADTCQVKSHFYSSKITTLRTINWRPCTRCGRESFLFALHSWRRWIGRSHHSDRSGWYLRQHVHPIRHFTKKTSV
jgi:ribosomal protein S27AE